jgi:hypothetical protein
VRRRVIPCLCIAFLLVLTAVPLPCQDLKVFPPAPLFPDTPADALAHQLSLSRLTDTREWIGAIGAAAPLLEWDGRVQFGVGATVFSRLIKTPGHITVATVDYRVDFPVDLRFDSLRVRVAFGHVSCHYADDGIEQLGRRSISSVRDYLALTVAWMIPDGSFYAGATDNYHNEPLVDRRWHLQAGGEMTAWTIRPGLSLYGAVDLKVKQDVHWGSTQSYQVGFRLSAGGGRNLRVAYTHRRGFEERGQLFDQQTVMNLLGVYIDLL